VKTEMIVGTQQISSTKKPRMTRGSKAGSNSARATPAASEAPDTMSETSEPSRTRGRAQSKQAAPRAPSKPRGTPLASTPKDRATTLLLLSDDDDDPEHEMLPASLPLPRREPDGDNAPLAASLAAEAVPDNFPAIGAPPQEPDERSAHSAMSPAVLENHRRVQDSASELLGMLTQAHKALTGHDEKLRALDAEIEDNQRNIDRLTTKNSELKSQRAAAIDSKVADEAKQKRYEALCAQFASDVRNPISSSPHPLGLRRAVSRCFLGICDIDQTLLTVLHGSNLIVGGGIERSSGGEREGGLVALEEQCILDSENR
jgi:hypothetical protein